MTASTDQSLVCVSNKDYEVTLTVGKTYRQTLHEESEVHAVVFVTDDQGQTAPYPAHMFERAPLERKALATVAGFTSALDAAAQQSETTWVKRPAGELGLGAPWGGGDGGRSPVATRVGVAISELLHDCFAIDRQIEAIEALRVAQPRESRPAKLETALTQLGQLEGRVRDCLKSLLALCSDLRLEVEREETSLESSSQKGGP